jgi:hypothetical protein
MSFEPVLFDNTMYETANEAFLFCRATLLRRGNLVAARYLEGLDPIHQPSLARVALQALHAAKPYARGESLEYVNIAIDAMERALETRPQRAVA